MTNLFWLRRRQSYQPATSDTPAPAEPPALPATAAAITALTGPERAEPVPAGLVPVDQLPAGGIALTGPGAYAAARGLLVTALMAHSPTRVLITRQDWHALLGADAPTDAPIPGLHVSDDTDATLQHPRHPSPDTDYKRVLLLTRAHPAGALVTHDAAQLTTVVFDAPAPAAGIRWEVHTDGTVTSGAGHRRLCVLGERTAIDLLTLIAATHQPRATAPAPHSPPARPQTGPRTTETPLPGPVAATTSVPARLTVLGACRLVIDGTEVPIRRSAAWQLLVLLATREGGATGREVVEAVWPGLPPASISSRLYTTLSDLRSQLKPLLVDHGLIIRRDDRYALDPAVIDVDLWGLHAAARTAARTIATGTRLHAQRAVIDSYTGELAAGHTWPWLVEPRDTIRRHVLDAYVDLAAGLPAADAVQLLTDAIDVDPYNEHIHRLAIDALTGTGDHAAAARLQQTHIRRLNEAGLQPSPH